MPDNNREMSAPETVNQESGKIVEIIKLINKTEAEAEQKQAFAETEAKLIVRNAQEESERTSKQEYDAAMEKVERIKELTEAKSREIAINMLTQINNECEDLKEEARTRKDAAVVAVVERILNEWR